MSFHGRSFFGAGAVLAVVLTFALSGCGGGSRSVSPTIPSEIGPAAVAREPGAYDVIYRFAGSPDAAEPGAGLIDVGGTLYGTTYRGGSNDTGTVFEISTSGAESVVHSFVSVAGGRFPAASLIDVGGTLYGTTSYGGTGERGTVFGVTTSGTESVLHSFSRYGTGGFSPLAGLVNVDDTLYGTTSDGGFHSDQDGTVFKIATSGAYDVLHVFRGNPDDGAIPYANLIDVGGTLYGTTLNGGGDSEGGTVFEITTSGAERVLHKFTGGADGYLPTAALLDVGGALYGTTGGGGTGCAGGCGTVFKVTTSGKESVVHSFAGGADGSDPGAGLIDVGGTLYGTTVSGGTGCASSGGCGTVFKITASGAESVLHSFTGGADGAFPDAGLVDIDGTLYGTTFGGGGGTGCANYGGCGTVFSIRT